MAKGLGRGLDAFFSEDNEDTIAKVTKKAAKKKEDAVLDSVVELNITEVEPMLNQPRKVFDKEKLQELTDSIKEHGVIQPILVVKNKNGYSIVAGERRWRAAKNAGLEKIPAIVKDYTDEKKKQVALIENIQREDLNVVEVAQAIKELMDIEGYNSTDVAKITGKSLSTISNITRLLKLPEEIQQMVLDGKLVEGHARALLAIEDEEKQVELAKKIAEKNLTVRDVEKLVYVSEAIKTKKKKKTRTKNVYYTKIEDKLKERLGYKVKLDSTNKHQRMIIEYNDDEGLESLLSLLDIDL